MHELFASVGTLCVIPSCLGAEYWFANQMARVTSSGLIGKIFCWRFCFEGGSVGNVELD